MKKLHNFFKAARGDLFYWKSYIGFIVQIAERTLPHSEIKQAIRWSFQICFFFAQNILESWNQFICMGYFRDVRMINIVWHDFLII